jgi:hypothetical protein
MRNQVESRVRKSLSLAGSLSLALAGVLAGGCSAEPGEPDGSESTAQQEQALLAPHCHKPTQELRAALLAAQQCTPAAAEQCATSVPGPCCPELVASPDSPETLTYLRLREQFKKTGCPVLCLASLCRVPTPGVCSEEFGTCVNSL